MCKRVLRGEKIYEDLKYVEENDLQAEEELKAANEAASTDGQEKQSFLLSSKSTAPKIAAYVE